MKTVARAADGSSFRSTDTPHQARHNDEEEKEEPSSCGGDAQGMRDVMSSHDDRVVYDARSAATSEGAEEAEQLTDGSEHMLGRG